MSQSKSDTDNQIVSTASQAAALFRESAKFTGSMEGFFVLPLDANGLMLSKPIMVSLGHEDGTTTVEAGEVFRAALMAGASEIIVAHNHPSGDPRPSKADLETTSELKDLAYRLKVLLLDHLIIGDPDSAGGTGFFSIAEISE